MDTLTQLLKRIFAETDYFTEDQWIVCLGTDKKSFDSWTSGEVLIPHDKLISIYELLHYRKFTKPEVIDEFEALLSKSVKNPTDGGFVRHSIPVFALGSYMNLGLLNGFMGVLSTINYHQQREILHKAAEMARTIRDT